jgi:hypothetical protein
VYENDLEQERAWPHSETSRKFVGLEQTLREIYSQREAKYSFSPLG